MADLRDSCLSGFGSSVFSSALGALVAVGEPWVNCPLVWAGTGSQFPSAMAGMGGLARWFRVDVAVGLTVLGLAALGAADSFACGGDRATLCPLGTEAAARQSWQSVLFGIAVGHGTDRSLFLSDRFDSVLA